MTPGLGGCKVGVPGTIGWDVALFLSTTSCLTCLFRNGAEQHVAACGEYRLVTLIASEIMQYIAQETKELPEEQIFIVILLHCREKGSKDKK